MIATILLGGAIYGTQFLRPYYKISEGKTEIRAYLHLNLETNSHKFYKVNVEFKKLIKGRLRTIGTFDCGYTFGMPETLMLGYYAENGRNQLYVVTKDSRRSSFVLDCDGQNITTIYKNTYADTHLMYDTKDGYYIIESTRQDPIFRRFFLRQSKSHL